MVYNNAKVYFDGNHYIAIPHTSQPWKKRKSFNKLNNQVLNDTKEQTEKNVPIATLDLDQLFESLYKENLNKKHRERKKEITNEMKLYFQKEERLKDFVEKNLQRKLRNLIERRKRFVRKVYLQEWSYFCTFTYDNKKHNEDSFKTKLSNALKHLSNRKGWKYTGVWEQSPKNNRLHFHALIYIPNNDLEFIEVRDFSTKSHKMQTTYQSKYFLERFGRNDFEPIGQNLLGKSIAYIMKYLGKTEARIVYSKGLPTYFISDIMEDDIVCTIGIEDRKLLLFDNFNCWDEGVLIGKVNKETISQLRKSN